MKQKIIKRGWKALYVHSKLLDCLFELYPIDFRVYAFPITIKGRARHLFGFTFHRWQNPRTVNRESVPKCSYLSFDIFYLPSLDFRIGDGKKWLWVRSENWYAYKCYKENRRKLYGNDMPF